MASRWVPSCEDDERQRARSSFCEVSMSQTSLKSWNVLNADDKRDFCGQLIAVSVLSDLLQFGFGWGWDLFDTKYQLFVFVATPAEFFCSLCQQRASYLFLS